MYIMKKLTYLFALSASILVACDKGDNVIEEVVHSEYAINIADDIAGGSIEASVAGEVVTKAFDNDDVALTATPVEGYRFLKWKNVEGVVLSNDSYSPAMFYMPKNDVSVSAEFTLEYYTINVTAGAGGMWAEARIDGSLFNTAVMGTEVEITAQPNDGYSFLRWDAEGVTLDNPDQNPTTFIMPASDVSLQAQFVLTAAAEGVVINGVRWAYFNVGAPGAFTDDPEADGMYYQFNRRTGWIDGLVSSPSGETWNGTGDAGTAWAPENDPCPTGWRVPTNSELTSLSTATSEPVWVDPDDFFSPLAGRRYIDPTTNDFIFLPASGYLSTSFSGDLMSYQNNGYYSSSVPMDDTYNWVLTFAGGYGMVDAVERGSAATVRCVKAE